MTSADLTESHYRYDERNRLYEYQREFYRLDESTGDRIPSGSTGTAITALEYDRRGLRIAEVDPCGRRMETDFDGVGREIAKRYPAIAGLSQPNREEIDYDADSNVLETRAFGFGLEEDGTEFSQIFTTRSTYDSLNRVLTSTNEPDNAAMSAKTSFSYDSLGNVTRERNPNKDKYSEGDEEGVGTTYVYDSLGRLLKSGFGHGAWSEGLILSTPDHFIDKQMTYNDLGSILTETDDLGKTTSYEYDHLSRRTRIEFADGSSEESELRSDGLLERLFAYDSSENLEFVTQYAYDAVKHLIEEEVTYAAPGYLGWRYKAHIYDGADQVVKTQCVSVDPMDALNTHVTTTETTYDSHGNPVSQRQILDDGAQRIHDRTIQCDFDEVGNRLNVESGNDYAFSFTYDALNRVSTVADAPSAPSPNTYADYAYVGPGKRLTRCEHPFNGTDTVRGPDGWDARGRPIKITHREDVGGSWSSFWEVTQSHDRMSNRENELKSHDPAKNREFVYDPADRLTDVTGYHPESFGLDGVGSWITHSYDGGPTHSNSTGDLNEYTTSFDGNTISHDDRGNTTQFDDISFVFDINGRVVAASMGVESWIYVFDSGGRRIAKKEVAGGGTWTNFTYMNELEILEEVGATTRAKVWDPNGNLVLYATDGIPYGVHLDALGSVVALTDSGGELAESYDYDPYGRFQVTDHDGGGLSGLVHLWTGKRYDAETGNYYFLARSYSSELGRFMSRDPLGVWGDSLARGCAYLYGGSNPYLYIDPTGLIPGLGCPTARGKMQDLAKAVINVNVSLEKGAANFVGVDSTITRNGRLLDIIDNPDAAESKVAFTAGAIGAEVAAAYLTGGSSAAATAGRAGLRGMELIEAGEGIVAGAGKIGSGDLLGGALEIGEAISGAVGRGGGKPAGRGCFVKGTPVWTPRGPQPIESVSVGDTVLTPESADDDSAGVGDECDTAEDDDEPWIVAQFEVPGVGPRIREIILLRPASWLEGLKVGQTKRFELSEVGWSGRATLVAVENVDKPCTTLGRLVTGTFVGISTEIVQVKLEGGTSIRATTSHPFYSEGRGWVSASGLREGDELRGLCGSRVKVASVQRLPGKWTVYNLEVAREHVYYVSHTAVLVHNSSEGAGRGGNRLQPDPNAKGQPHSTFRTDEKGRVTHHAEWDADGFPVKRTDVTGGPHRGIDTPHTHEYGPPNTNPETGKKYPGREINVRPATQDEIPGWAKEKKKSGG